MNLLMDFIKRHLHLWLHLIYRDIRQIGSWQTDKQICSFFFFWNGFFFHNHFIQAKWIIWIQFTVVISESQNGNSLTLINHFLCHLVQMERAEVIRRGTLCNKKNKLDNKKCIALKNFRGNKKEVCVYKVTNQPNQQNVQEVCHSIFLIIFFFTIWRLCISLGTLQLWIGWLIFGFHVRWIWWFEFFESIFRL